MDPVSFPAEEVHWMPPFPQKPWRPRPESLLTQGGMPACLPCVHARVLARAPEERSGCRHAEVRKLLCFALLRDLFVGLPACTRTAQVHRRR
jgi:hypothetical protein